MVDPSRISALNGALELMHFAYREMIAGPDKVLEQRGLGRVHHRILYFVARKPGVRVGELQATLAITKQALHPPLQQLVRGGLVEVAPSPTSGRVKLLRLSRSGGQLEARLTGPQRAWFERTFVAVGEEDEAAFRRVLGRLSGKT